MTAEWMTGTEESLEGTTELGSVRDETLGELRYPSLGREQPADDKDDQPFPFIPTYAARLFTRVFSMFERQRIRVLETIETPVRIPLFLLGCADVEGCTATFGRETSEVLALKWDMTIYGSGHSRSRELAVSVATKFSATAGQVKMVFLDLTLPVERIEIRKARRTIGIGVQINGAGVKPAASPGLYVLSAVSPPPTGAEITHFPLSGDTTGALTTYQWIYSRSNRSTATVGINAFNMKLNFSYESMLAEQTSLTFELRGGHDYTMLAAAEGDGVLWGRSTPSAGPETMRT